MSAFSYVAIDRAGRRTTGTVGADTRAAAMDEVVRQGLSPLSLQETGADGASVVATDGVPAKVPAKSVEAFTRELANLLAGGLPLARALALLKREASHASAKATWTRIHDAVVGGESLGDALAKYPQAFSGVYVAMVRAGEAGGFLPIVLQQISDFRQRERDLTGRVKSAMIYPVVLAAVATVVLIALLTFFIPKFSGIFEQFGSKLPFLTQVVVAISGVLLTYGPFIAAALAVALMALRRWTVTPPGQRFVEQVVLRTPLLGTIAARFALVRFCRMLGTLIAAGVPLVAALRVAREALGNQSLADSISLAIEQVQRGTALSRALANNSQLFPPSVIEMIAMAEETSRVDKELVRLAGAYEGDLDRLLRMFVALAEPLLLVVMAALIGTVVVSMLLPVFTLQDMIN